MSNTTVGSTAEADPTSAATSSIFTSESTFSTTTSSVVEPTTTSTPTTSTTSTTPITTSTTPTSTATPTTQEFTTSTTPTSTSTSATQPTTSTTAPDTSVALITSVVTVTPTGTTGGAAQETTIIITSTASNAEVTSTATNGGSGSSSTTSGAASLVSGSSSSSSSAGLSASGKIAIAVVVPIVAIAAIAAALLFFWKKRKARKAEEEERKKEMEEYGYNPNNDPTLPPVGATSVGDESEMKEDGGGYRGWGATSSSARKASTTLSSGRGFGMAHSDEGSSQPGGYSYVQQHSPTGAEFEGYHDGMNAAPPMEYYGNGEPIGQAVSGAPVAAGAAATANNKDMQRGLSNASSGYSGRPHSEASEDGGGMHPAYNDYYEMQPQHGPYGDGSYGGGQPIIRDVQARRNTRIEKPTVFPHQGNTGIAANF